MESNKRLNNSPIVIQVLFFSILISLLFSGASFAGDSLILGTTTSVNDSGLLDELTPQFTKHTGIKVKVIAVGTGQAIEMGRRGEVDVLLVHAKELEEEFVKKGYGVSRVYFMYNDFVIVGPENDPAAVSASKSAAEAFRKIYERKNALFFSRGDNSGTEKMERNIWAKANLQPYAEKWYKQAGLGMGQTLFLTSEKKGYTLSDRGTYLMLQGKLALAVLLEKDPFLKNEYSLIAVNNARFPKVNYKGAEQFIKFMTSKEVLKKIRGYGVIKHGFQLFIPDFK